MKTTTAIASHLASSYKATAIGGGEYTGPFVPINPDVTVQPYTSTTPPASSPTSSKSSAANGKPLSDAQQKQIDELKKRDADVRRHEQAHLAAAGGFARSGAVYNYQTGPDGKQYAVGGHVDIDAGAVPNNPQATIQKMQTVERAALAPADPSGEDRAVAAQAAQTLAKAQSEERQKQSGSTKGGLLDVTA